MVTELRRAALAGASLLTVAGLAGCASGGGGQTALGTRSGAPDGSASATSAPPSAAASVSAPASASSASSGASGVASTSIPAAAWIQPSAIPLYAKYHWPSPASTAKPAKAPALSAVQDCQLTLSSSDQAELGAFPAAQAELSPTGGSGGQDDWSAVETILATNDTSSGDIQGIFSLYTDLVADLGRCAAAGAKVSVAADQGPGYAATITIPTSTGSTLTWHEYLTAPYGYLIELAVYVAPYSGDQPGAAWDGTSVGSVLSALQSGPCSITKLC